MLLVLIFVAALKYSYKFSFVGVLMNQLMSKCIDGDSNSVSAFLLTDIYNRLASLSWR